jgi:YD repeat-containing protein
MKSLINRMIEKAKGKWKFILEVVGVITLIVLIIQLRIQIKQFEQDVSEDQYSRSQEADIKYTYMFRFLEGNEGEVFQKTNKLIESYYNSLTEKKNENPNDSYSNILNNILPMTETLSPQPISLQVYLENSGLKTANKVRVKVDLGRPITYYSSDTSELINIVQGNLGDNSITIEVDRIVSKSEMYINFTSNASDEKSLDKIILRRNKLYYYDDTNRSLRVTNEKGETITYIYNEDGNLIAKIDKNGNKLQYSYDSKGRIEKAVDPQGRETRFQYDSENRLTSITEPYNGEPVNTNNGNFYTEIYDRTEPSETSFFHLPTVQNLDVLTFPKVEYLSSESPTTSIVVTHNDGIGHMIDK